MNAPTASQDNPCFTDFALQEYVLGRLSPEVRIEVQEHMQSCPQCAACAGLIAKETELLRAALGASAGSSSAAAIDDETLSLYLGDSLDAQSREACEKALVTSPKLRERLTELRRDLEAVLGDTGAAEISKVRVEGRILRMPKRSEVPRNFSDLTLSDSEAAEG